MVPHPPILVVLRKPVSQTMWTAREQVWRESGARLALRDVVDAAIRRELEWQRWLERYEER